MVHTLLKSDIKGFDKVYTMGLLLYIASAAVLACFPYQQLTVAPKSGWTWGSLQKSHQAPFTVLFKHPCNLGLPELLAVALMKPAASALQKAAVAVGISTNCLRCPWLGAGLEDEGSGLVKGRFRVGIR